MNTLNPIPLPDDVVDLCSGIGGWEVALRERSLRGLAVENNTHARNALVANGVTLYHDDMTTLLDDRARRIWLRHTIRGAVGSTPCQPFSQANLNARGLDDERGNLTVAWLEIVESLTPSFACLENVPRGTGPVFDVLVERLTAAGYVAGHRVVNAADYGDGQARKRRLLVARRDGMPLAWPEATHANTRTGSGLHSVRMGRRKPWVTLAETLPDRGDLPPWAHTHPSTTIVGSFRPECVAPPTYRKPGDGPRQSQPGVVETTLDERLRIQGFPSGWQTSGGVSARGLQVGNAIPPTLARVALAAALD